MPGLDKTLHNAARTSRDRQREARGTVRAQAAAPGCLRRVPQKRGGSTAALQAPVASSRLKYLTLGGFACHLRLLPEVRAGITLKVSRVRGILVPSGPQVLEKLPLLLDLHQDSATRGGVGRAGPGPDARAAYRPYGNFIVMADSTSS